MLKENDIDFIIGDRIKSLPNKIKEELLDRTKHKQINRQTPIDTFSYTEIDYQDRRIICTYSEKRAKKDAHNRQKLIDKAKNWISNPSQYKQVKKRGAGRFINTDNDGVPKELNEAQIKADSKYDGFKAISTTTNLNVEDILNKYKDLFEVEHSFRALKTELEIRPMYHWTNKRIKDILH